MTNESSFPPKNILLDSFCGLEREGQRITQTGRLAQSDHPKAWGNKLTHSLLTTDYAESQPEYITKVCRTLEEAMTHQTELQAWAARKMNSDEQIWPMSMPPTLTDAEIRISDFGDTPAGIEKTVYRRGLGLRYGKAIQTICGVHYAHSWGDGFWSWKAEERGYIGDLQPLKDATYLSMIRGFLRRRWLLVGAFGSSPTGYNEGVMAKYPHAVSLRMSPAGYSNTRARRNFLVSYNDIPTHVAQMREAIVTPMPEWAALGTNDANGVAQQLNGNMLQIAAEYYSPIRAKVIPQDGEDGLTAMERHGITYVEVRTLDLCPDQPTGLCPMGMRFVQLLLTAGSVADEPLLDADERTAMNAVQTAVALQGRDPKLQITHNGDTGLYTHLAQKELETLRPLATAMGDVYVQALELAMARIATGNEIATAYAKVQAKDLTALAAQHKATLLAYPLSDEVLKKYDDMAANSWNNNKE